MYSALATIYLTSSHMFPDIIICVNNKSSTGKKGGRRARKCPRPSLKNTAVVRPNQIRQGTVPVPSPLPSSPSCRTYRVRSVVWLARSSVLSVMSRSCLSAFLCHATCARDIEPPLPREKDTFCRIATDHLGPETGGPRRPPPRGKDPGTLRKKRTLVRFRSRLLPSDFSHPALANPLTNPSRYEERRIARDRRISRRATSRNFPSIQIQHTTT